MTLLPDGHRIRYRFFWTPIVVAGREHWLDTVCVVQRLVKVHRFGMCQAYQEWHDVGFYDELFPDWTARPDAVPELE